MDGPMVHSSTYLVGEFLGPVLMRRLKHIYPTAHPWTVPFRGPGGDAGGRPTPHVTGTIDVDLRCPPRNLPFTVHRVEAPPRKAVDIAELGIDRDRLGSVNVLATCEVHDLMAKWLPLSERLEEGGFLLGRIHSVADDPERRFTEITHVTPATNAGASAVDFTFTADSFRDVNQILDERDKGEELVGWYHTHLWSTSSDIGIGTGLSDVDVETHLATFRRSGQVAGLIELSDGPRALRFYGWTGSEIEQCMLWIGDERGRYRSEGRTVPAPLSVPADSAGRGSCSLR